MPKKRLDLLLVERGLAVSRAKAQALIMAGQVRADGQVLNHTAEKVSSDMAITIDSGPRFVSRGGEKLVAALTVFNIIVLNCVCADVGASTGGFTDCLLQHGALKVYAIDVGKGILHWKLRNDPRVVVMEETNARFIEKLPEPVTLVTIDASFISLKILLPVVKGWFESNPAIPASIRCEDGKGRTSQVIALVKPQFEAGRKETARGKGVIRDPKIHRTVLTNVLTLAQEQGFAICGLMRSPILGPKGNAEFLTWMKLGKKENADLHLFVDRVIE